MKSNRDLLPGGRLLIAILLVWLYCGAAAAFNRLLCIRPGFLLSRGGLSDESSYCTRTRRY